MKTLFHSHPPFSSTPPFPFRRCWTTDVVFGRRRVSTSLRPKEKGDSRGGDGV